MMQPSHHHMQEFSTFQMRVCLLGLLCCPGSSQLRDSVWQTQRGFPPAHQRAWSLLRNETSFTCSETDTFVCDRNFWMRLLEKRDLWSCLVEPDDSLNGCGSLPQLRKSSLCRRKRLLFESLIAFWLLWPDVLN